MLLFCEYDSYFYIIHYISKEEFQHIDFFIQPIFHFLKKIFFYFFHFLCLLYKRRVSAHFFWRNLTFSIIFTLFFKKLSQRAKINF